MILTDKDFREEIESLHLLFPKALEANEYVEHLAPRVSELLRREEQLFNVAVVGQMRVGKSSLLNALVEVDGLAITGVEETTATINWFKYGQGEQTKKVRVTWKDRAQQEYPRDKIFEMVGQSEQAAQAACIELFAEASFLKTANLVDTPGTRSSIDSHEETTQEFLDLAQKHEQESKRLGVAADAIVYVFPPIAREKDDELLAEYGEGSRITGSSAYNSIGVLHKWDGQNVEDPISFAKEKALELSRKMEGKVSTVLPVSAPLLLASLKKESFWLPIHQIAQKTNPGDMEELLDEELAFIEDEVTSCPIPTIERQRLRKSHPLPWSTLRLIIRQASKNRFKDSNELCNWARTASGIEGLRKELKRRFFSRSSMLRNLALLSKLHTPGYEAVTILENKKRTLSSDIDRLPSYVQKIKKTGDSSLSEVTEYLQSQKSESEKRLSQLIKDHKTIDALRNRTQETAEPINRDLKAIEELDQEENSKHIPNNLFPFVKSLLGGNGFDRQTRFSASLEEAEELLEELHKLKHLLPSKTVSIIDQAMVRLEQITEYLEGISVK